jgi:uncharacterized membrane protein YdbT with pleckstrin-like domain
MVAEERTMSKSETVLYQASPAMFRCSPVRFAVYGLSCFLVIGIPIMVVWWLRCKSTQLTVTNQKVSLRTGILSKALNEVRIEHIRNVQLRQGVLQRILGVGWIGVSSSGQGGLEIEVDGIPSPAKVKSIIDGLAR